MTEPRAVAQAYDHWCYDDQVEKVDLSAFITDWVPNTNPTMGCTKRYLIHIYLHYLSYGFIRCPV